jgi:hypothetical protein
VSIVRKSRRRLFSITAAACAAVSSARAATDQHFDYTSFDNPNTPGITPHFGQAQFNVLNYPSINGNYMMTSTDTQRSQMTANNNNLAEFYNWFEQRYEAHTTKDGAVSAAEIDAYVTQYSNNTGAKPTWLILNEISASQWPVDPGVPSLSTYRQWVVDTVTQLHDTYGYNVVTYAPFATVGTGTGSNAASWQALAAKSYIGVENYLSGEEVMSGGSDYASRVAWAQAQYQASKDTYSTSDLVPFSKLFLGEDYANTVAGTGWGRAGLSASDWDTVIQIRQDALKNIGFPGFLAYSWGGNGMGITEAEQIQHEYWYRTRLCMPGQQPQWLSDNAWTIGDANTAIPLSWGQQLNWLGGIPSASGAIANFYRTNTAARTVTLDGNRTVGTLSFDSANSYTIAQGTSGSLTLKNSSGVNVSVVSGSHTISAPITVSNNTTFNIAGTLSLTGTLTNSPAKTLTKTGTGTLNINGAQTHGSGAVFTASAGTTNFNSSGGTNLGITANAAVNFGVPVSIGTLTVNSGQTATVNVGANPFKAKTLTLTNGRLQLNNSDAIFTGMTRASIEAFIKAGRGPGDWQGTGITSSYANATAGQGSTALGVISASDTGLQNTGFDNQTVAAGDTIVKYTYAGDANLDGVVNFDDFNRYIVGVSGQAPARWFTGDFNYSGAVDFDDFNKFIAGFSLYNTTGIVMAPPEQSTPASFAISGASAAPEPSSAACGVAALLLLRRRKHNHETRT